MSLRSASPRLSFAPFERPQVFLLVFAALERILIFLSYRPIEVSDSVWYVEAARSLQRFQWSFYNTARPPGYPLFLAATGTSPMAIFAAQLLLGIAITMLLYTLFTHIGRSTTAGMVAGIAYSLNPSTVLFEACISTETVAIFLLVLVFLAVIRVAQPGSRSLDFILLNIFAVLVALTRPMFLFLPVAVLVFEAVVLARQDANTRSWVARFAAQIVIVALPFAGVVALNKSERNYAGVSSLAGYSLINHAGAFIDDAPDRFEPVKGLYLRERERTVSSTGSQTMTIWRVRQQIEDSTHMSFEEVSVLLTQLSLYSIASHPVSYLRSVSRALVLYWEPASAYRGYRGFSWPAPLKPLLIIIAACVILCVPITAAELHRSIRTWKLAGRDLLEPEYVLLAVLFLAWIISSAADIGENARYKTTTEPFLVGFACVAAVRLRAALLLSRKSTGPEPRA